MRILIGNGIADAGHLKRNIAASTTAQRRSIRIGFARLVVCLYLDIRTCIPFAVPLITAAGSTLGTNLSWICENVLHTEPRATINLRMLRDIRPSELQKRHEGFMRTQ